MTLVDVSGDYGLEMVFVISFAIPKMELFDEADLSQLDDKKRVEK